MGTPHEALRLIASVFLTTLDDPTNLSVFRVMVGEAARNPGIAAAWHAQPDLRAMDQNRMLDAAVTIFLQGLEAE